MEPTPQLPMELARRMRIYVYSRSFSPAIGGMERLMEVLAREFVRMGHGVTVVTETPGEAELLFPVVRAPKLRQAFALARNSDVIIAAPLSLRRLPLHLLSRRPILVAHPILYLNHGRHLALSLVKRLAARLVTSVVPSRFMATHFPGAQVIPNPYDAATFDAPESKTPRRDLLFVGRLVPEKGCDILLRAFATSGVPDRLTIVGDGPERGALARQAEVLGIATQIEFRGELTGPALADVMRVHRVMVVPTLCEEAFGIVALEGLASGCRMIVADSGGLPEAVGSFALTFPRGDVSTLTACLQLTLGPDDKPPSRCDIEAHLKNFRPEQIAQRYLAVIDRP